METCPYKEGYLLIYSESSDEIHANLISEDHYNNILNLIDDSDAMEEEAFKVEPLFGWFSQTQCNEPWPYTNVKILGTIHVWCI